MKKIDIINLANEKGYNDIHPCYVENYGDDPENWCSETALMQKWLRDKYCIFIRVASNGLELHFPINEILQLGGGQMKGPPYTKNYKTYEEALDVGIYEALKLIRS